MKGQWAIFESAGLPKIIKENPKEDEPNFKEVTAERNLKEEKKELTDCLSCS